MTTPFSSPRTLLGKVYMLLSGLNSVAHTAGDRVATLLDVQSHIFASGAANPLVTYDLAHGYVRGSRYLNTTTREIFESVDATNGAAVWKTIKPAVYNYTPAAGAKQVTATAVKTAPAAVTGALPANIPVGAKIVIDAAWKVTASTGAETGAFTIETSAGDVLLTEAAFNLTDNDIVSQQLELVVGTTGASGKLHGWKMSMHTAGTPSTGMVVDLAADLSAAVTIAPYCQFSDVGDTADLRKFRVEVWTNP